MTPRLLFAFLIALAALSGHASSAGALPKPRTVVAPAGLPPELRHARGTVRVTIQLRVPRQRVGRAASTVARDLSARPTAREARLLASEQHAAVVPGIEARRTRALRALQPQLDRAAREQQPTVEAIRRLGARIESVDALVATAVARVSARRLRAIARIPGVYSIERRRVARAHASEHAVAAVGAPAFWAAGFTGGTGPSDLAFWRDDPRTTAVDPTGPDLAIADTGIYTDHPAFAGIRFQAPVIDRSGQCGRTAQTCGHGTEVASMAISRGATTADPTDAGRKGIAPGIDSVLDAPAGGNFSRLGWMLGFTQYDPRWGTLPGAADPAEVSNSSNGSRQYQDDGTSQRTVDSAVSTFGVTWVFSAGNDGLDGPQTLSCIAYNAICVGSVALKTLPGANADLQVKDYSSRGPTLGGRKKPDLVAVGNTSVANANWEADGSLWTSASGTSFAAPQVSGAAILLAGSGVTDHLGQKAILINSARQGRATPTDPMGTQSGWQPDWGWGALNLNDALGQRDLAAGSTPGHYALDEIAGGDVHFYRAATQAAGDRATLVWDRRTTGGCVTLSCYGYPTGSSPLVTATTLTNLDLEETDSTGARKRASSASAIDNVEQTRSPGAADVVYKVRASSSVDWRASEPYALAATRELRRLVTPRPHVAATISADRIRPGQPVTVSATITNPSQDLDADGVSASLDLPAGAEVLSSPAPVGTLAKSQSVTRSWVVRFAADGAHSVKVNVAASALGEDLPASASRSLTVDGTAPSAQIHAPAGSTTATSLSVSWSASDGGVGVASHDVQASVNGSEFQPWLTATTQTSAVYSAQAGSSYQFRSRARDQLANESAWAAGPVVHVVSPSAPPGSTPTVSPQPTVAPTPIPTIPPPGKAASSVRISRATLTAGRITASGMRTAAATGRVTVTFSAKIGSRTRKVSRALTVSRGAWKLSLKLPVTLAKVKTGKLTVSYAGDARHKPARAATKTLRRR